MREAQFEELTKGFRLSLLSGVSYANCSAYRCCLYVAYIRCIASLQGDRHVAIKVEKWTGLTEGQEGAHPHLKTNQPSSHHTSRHALCITSLALGSQVGRQRPVGPVRVSVTLTK